MLQDSLSASFTREVHFPLMPGIWKVRRWQVYFAWLKWKSWCINKNRSAPETNFANTSWHTWSMWQKVTVLKLIHETNIFPHGFPLFWRLTGASSRQCFNGNWLENKTNSQYSYIQDGNFNSLFFCSFLEIWLKFVLHWMENLIVSPEKRMLLVQLQLNNPVTRIRYVET